MGLITIAQAFTVSVSKFDTFLSSNNLSTLAGYRPDCDDINKIEKLFRDKGVPNKVKVFVPYLPGYDLTNRVYVCCDWFHVLASRELPDGVLQEPVHPAFEEMRKVIGAEGPVSRYVIYHEQGDLEFIHQESVRRNTYPVYCGICDEAFNFWRERMKHRREVHQISEDQNPLPDC